MPANRGSAVDLDDFLPASCRGIDSYFNLVLIQCGDAWLYARRHRGKWVVDYRLMPRTVVRAFRQDTLGRPEWGWDDLKIHQARLGEPLIFGIGGPKRGVRWESALPVDSMAYVYREEAESTPVDFELKDHR